MNRTLCLILLPIALLTLRGSNGLERTEIYRNDFESGDTSRWSMRRPGVSSSPQRLTTSVTGDGTERVLGEFGSQEVILRLDKLPPHDSLTVTCDLLIIRSWDGNNRQFGPDIWDLSIDDSLLLHTTFSNTTYSQSFPGAYPSANNPARTGVEVADAYGYTWSLPGIFSGPMDAMYRITRTIPHSHDSTAISFSASLVDAPGDGLANESWALDNVSVTLVGTPRRADTLVRPFIRVSTGE